MIRQRFLLGVGLFLVVAAGSIGGSVYLPTADHAPASETGPRNTTIAFENVSDEAGLTYEVHPDGSGASDMISDVGIYPADIDKDGWTDVLAVGGDRPVLFTNDQGEFHRSKALPRLNQSVRSALFVDYNADGWQDLLFVSDGNKPVLLRNTGGLFERVDGGFDQALNVPIGATTADYNNDGCPDLFIIQNGQWDDKPPLGLGSVSVPLDDDNGNPNMLFRGTCAGFERVDDADIEGTRWSLATSFVDLTGDGWPDIHVANDFNHDILYVNQRDRSFDRVVLSNRTDRNGMASEVADITGDGRPDVFTTNIYYPPTVKEEVPTGQKARADGNTLLVNQGNGSFVDRADEFNVRKGGWGWAAAIEDFDNDGQLDLFHTTQRVDFSDRNLLMSLDELDIKALEVRYPSYKYPLIAVGNESGFDRKRASKVGFTDTDGRGVATLDYDRDGRLDLVVTNADGAFKLYQNVGNTGSSLQVTLDGQGETLAIGATVSVITETETVSRQYASNSDFLSQSARTLHFGMGDVDKVTVRVEWPDGTTQTFEDVPTGQRIRVTPTDGVVAAEEYDR